MGRGGRGVHALLVGRSRGLHYHRFGPRCRRYPPCLAGGKKRKRVEPSMEDAPYLRSPPHALSPARAGMFLRKAAATCSRPPP